MKTIIIKSSADGQSRYMAMVLIVMIALSGVVSVAFADEASDKAGLKYYKNLSDAELNVLRGGFVTPDGLHVNVGIEKLIYINGVMQSQFQLDLSDLKARLGGISERAGSQIQPSVIDYADGQSLAPSNMVTIVQNMLDEQTIKSLTGLDITVSNVAGLRRTNIGRLISFEVTRSLGMVK